MTTSTTAAMLPDQQRRAELKRMKMFATALLVAVALAFIIARVFESSAGWVGYLRAMFEAAMVGAIADWFAVTALFRHPLGLPIPHTAIIEKRKDQIGDSLGAFVQDNFLTREVVAGRLADAGLAARLGQWLSQPDNAATVGSQSAAVVGAVTEVLRDETVQHGMEQVVLKRVKAIPVSPLVGKAVDVAVEGDHHQRLLEITLIGISKFLAENQVEFRKRLSSESPWWVPETVDDRVFDKIYDGLYRFLNDLGREPEHPLRQQLDAKTAEMALRLKSDPELVARGETLRDELMDHPEVRAWTASLWARIKSGLLDATNDPQSELRLRLDEAIVEAGQTVSNDPALQAKIDKWLVDSVGYVAEEFRGEVADLIASTVQRWDSAETSERLELQVGKDLQFIRINGTIVGGLAGLVIYTLSELFF